MAAKFKVGDRVKCRGQVGEVIEVVPSGPDEYIYSVRCDGWKKHETGKNPDSGEPTFRYENPAKKGELRDHEADTYGCVREWEMAKAGK